MGIMDMKQALAKQAVKPKSVTEELYEKTVRWLEEKKAAGVIAGYFIVNDEDTGMIKRICAKAIKLVSGPEFSADCSWFYRGLGVEYFNEVSHNGDIEDDLFDEFYLFEHIWSKEVWEERCEQYGHDKSI